MRRREFVGLMGISTLLSPLARSSTARPSVGEQAADVVIFDARYPYARRFAQRLAKRGAVLWPTEGELVSVWRENLALLTKSRSVRIAALVQHSDLQLLRELGRAHGLRVLQQSRLQLRGRIGTTMKRGTPMSCSLG